MIPVKKLLLDERQQRRRRLLLAMMASGLGAGQILRQAGAQELIASQQGMRSLDGDVRINGVPAALGDAVRPGDRVTTGYNAFAMFVVGRDAYLLREYSRVETQGSNQFISALRLLTGKLLGVYGRSNVTRQLATRTATIGIRGTGAYLEADAGRTYCCLCYGTAELTPMVRPDMRQVYATQHHDAPRFVYDDGIVRMMETAPMANHADYELIMLEALVGRKPPESFLAMGSAG